MGTSNFCFKNASMVFAVLTSREEKRHECRECNEVVYEYEDDYQPEGLKCHCGGELVHTEETVYPEEWECNDLIDNLQSELEKYGYSKSDQLDNDRNYPGRTFASKTIEKRFANVSFSIEVKAIIRGAYYDGANLDWEISYSDGYSDEIPDRDWIISELEYYGNISKGLATILAPKVETWFEHTANKLTDELEKQFMQWSDHKLQVAARFSNGETIYSEATV